ncbi:MaoC family dehydratase [Tepidiforma flava]|uniref:MaoC family dehydratase n=1 Tax=Tepidiforma flava TaxID=3004094 RepID=A0ABY7M8Z2_9CHLR|nr:MaoC family dehydratase [Tepidiforma flava]WBL36999.1 MaoC family dehydratase [Tepidiforma flava]
MTARAVRRLTAFLDGEDRPDIPNPIHSTAVAHAHGFAGPLVGGVTVYGWLVPSILELLGDGWLSGGWADVRFRRPVYPGDELEAVAEGPPGGPAALRMAKAEGAAIEGEAGLGRAPWLADLTLPSDRQPVPPHEPLPELTLETAPRGRDLPAMAVALSLEDARAWALEKQRDGHERWTGPAALAHPSWLAARATPLLKHSYAYGPSIHTRSQIQHLAPARAGQQFTVAGRVVDAFDDRGHHTAVLDVAIIDAAGTLVTHLRHTTIFLIRPR